MIKEYKIGPFQKTIFTMAVSQVIPMNCLLNLPTRCLQLITLVRKVEREYPHHFTKEKSFAIFLSISSSHLVPNVEVFVYTMFK